MANIRLKELIEANVDPKLVARSKESGKMVYFKTPQAKANAMKAGTHEDPKAKKGGQHKADAKPNNMFGADYSKDRGGDTKIQAFKSADGSDVGPNKYTTAISKIRPSDSSMKIKSDDWMDDLDSIDVSDIKGKADPSADSWTHGDVFGATFKDPQTGKPISVGDAYDREDDSPAYQKAFAYVAQFNPDDEAVMGTQAYDDLNKKAAPNVDVKSIANTLIATADKEFRGIEKLADYGKTLSDGLDTEEADSIELKKRLDAGEDGVYVQTDELEGVVVFSDGSQYEVEGTEDAIYATKSNKQYLKSIIKGLLKKADKEFKGAYKLKDVVDGFQDNIDDSDDDGKELKARLDKGEDGTYVQTDETEGTVVFNDGSQYEFSHVEDGPIPVTKVGTKTESTKLTSMIKR
jgi:hypothetical protein